MGEVSFFDFSCKNFSKPACGAIIRVSPAFSVGLGNFGASVDDAGALLIDPDARPVVKKFDWF